MNKQTQFIIAILAFCSFIFDPYLLPIAKNLRISFLNPFFIFIGSSEGILIFLIIIGTLFLIEKKKKYLLPLLITITLAIGITYLLKYTVLRPRPEFFPLLIKHTPSFPSTHAAVAGAAYFLVDRLKRTRILAFISIFLLALTGYYNGVHYLSDVLAGLLLGGVISYLVSKHYNHFWEKIKRKTKHHHPINHNYQPK